MKQSDLEKGNAVSTAVWKYIQNSRIMELTPWTCDPESDRYDPIAVAEHQGWKRAIEEVATVIHTAIQSYGDQHE